jgi:hypothetical protein
VPPIRSEEPMRTGPGEPEPGASLGTHAAMALDGTRAGHGPGHALRATASTHDEWCSAGTSDRWDPVSFSSHSRSKLRKRSRAACSLTSQTVCAPRLCHPFADSWSTDELGSLRQASAITYISHLPSYRRNESLGSHLGGRPSTPRWRLSSLALRPSARRKRRSVGEERPPWPAPQSFGVAPVLSRYR